MFDILSKVTEAKKRIEEVRAKLDQTKLTIHDAQKHITIVVSGAKDIKQVTLSDSFSTLSKSEQEALIQNTCKEALRQAETLAKEEMKKATEGIIPNIPGLNLFG